MIQLTSAEGCRNLIDAILPTDKEMIAEIAAMTPEEVDAALKEEGIDPEAGMERLRAVLAETQEVWGNGKS